MATLDSGRQRYSMNFCASHQRRSYTSRPGRRAEGQLRVNSTTLDFAANPYYDRCCLKAAAQSTRWTRTSHSNRSL